MKKKILAILLTLSLISGMALPGTMAVEAETGSDVLSVETNSNASPDETVYTGTLICELEEHSHSEGECYTMSEEPTCGLVQTHVHDDDSCYEMQGQEDEETGEMIQVQVLICEEEEIIPHEHGDGCYTAGELTCAVALSEGHTHGEGCYLTAKELTCGLSEDENHTHGDECYTTTSSLACTEAESAGHAHGAECYSASILTCDREEIPEHNHSTDCYEMILTCEKTEHQHTAECYEQTAGSVSGAQCNCDAVEGEAHAEDCPLYVALECTCDAGEGEAHAEDCPLYVAPECTCGAAEGEAHAEDCPMYVAPECTCGAEGLFHTSDCPLYEEPVTAAVYAEKDGVYTLLDTHGSANPLDMSAYNGKTVYILANTRPQNLYFTASGLVNTGVTYSVSESEYALLTSGDDKFTNHTALLTVAENAPAGTEFTLSAEGWIVTSYTVTVKVLDKLPEESGEPADTIYTESVEFDHGDLGIAFAGGTFASDQVALNAYVPELTDDQLTQIKSVIGEDVLDCYPMDISFTSDGQELQPLSGKSVTVHMTLDASCVPEDANMMVVVHLGAGGAEIVKEQYLSSGVDQQSLLFNASSFSTYVNVLVESQYDAKLLREVLTESARYQVVDLTTVGATVNLFDYDLSTFNTSTGNSDTTGFVIGGYSGAGINNSAAGYAKQGILKDELSGSGFPVMKYGKDVGEELFSTTKEVNGKTTYENVGFEFIYDTQTGTYIYASSLNHAQYNSATKKIELYADSLARENWASVDVDMTQTPPEYSRLTIDNSYTGTGIAGTLGDSITNSDGSLRMDPWLQLNTSSFVGKNTDTVTVKLKTDKQIDSATTFELFFKTSTQTTWAGTHQLVVSYPANASENADGWYEYTFEIALNSQSNKANWQGATITTFRVDVIESTTNYTNMKFVLEEIRVDRDLSNQGVNSRTNGGFYPFASIQSSYPGVEGAGDWAKETWASNLASATGAGYSKGTRAIWNGVGSDNSDLYFGVSLSVPFYLPMDKKTDSSSDVTYTFTGDDDLWVFVDGKLVLDIGGSHGAIKGEINFTQGTWSVDNAVQVNGLTSFVSATAEKVTGTFSIEPGEHTMQIFYMERAGEVSNCFMKFNLPTIPTGALSIKKEITWENIAPDANTDYTFTMSATNSGTAVDVNELKYQKWDTETGSFKEYTLTNGTLTLKAGQSAIFTEIPEGTKISVTETTPIVPTDAYYKYDKTTITGGTTDNTNPLTVTGTVTEDGSLSFVYTNSYKDAYFDLTITKEGSNETLDPNQTFIFQIKNGDTVLMDVVVKGNDSVTIKRLPVNDDGYTVEELTDWSWRYEVDSSDEGNTNPRPVDLENIKDGVVTFVFTNKRDNPYWLDGNSWCENLFNDSGIVKKEPEDADGTD